MDTTNQQQPNFALLLKSIDDPKLIYMTAKKLAELWPENNFVSWKAKLESGTPLILQRAKRRADLLALKLKLEEVHAPVDIVEQKSIGGKPVF